MIERLEFYELVSPIITILLLLILSANIWSIIKYKDDKNRNSKVDIALAIISLVGLLLSGVSTYQIYKEFIQFDKYMGKTIYEL